VTAILTPEQSAHVKRIQGDFSAAVRSLPLPNPATPRAIVVLFAAAWLRYASLAHPEWSKADAVAEFQRRMQEKYTRGVVEHGGNLMQAVGVLDMLAEEIIDGVAYASTAAEQRK
jgi:hypothetical protein